MLGWKHVEAQLTPYDHIATPAPQPEQEPVPPINFDTLGSAMEDDMESPTPSERERQAIEDECGHDMALHYRDGNGTLRCRWEERGTSTRGVIGLPTLKTCDCINGRKFKRSTAYGREVSVDELPERLRRIVKAKESPAQQPPASEGRVHEATPTAPVERCAARDCPHDHILCGTVAYIKPCPPHAFRPTPQWTLECAFTYEDGTGCISHCRALSSDVVHVDAPSAEPPEDANDAAMRASIAACDHLSIPGRMIIPATAADEVAAIIREEIARDKGGAPCNESEEKLSNANASNDAGLDIPPASSRQEAAEQGDSTAKEPTATAPDVAAGISHETLARKAAEKVMFRGVLTEPETTTPADFARRADEFTEIITKTHAPLYEELERLRAQDAEREHVYRSVNDGLRKLFNHPLADAIQQERQHAEEKADLQRQLAEREEDLRRMDTHFSDLETKAASQYKAAEQMRREKDAEIAALRERASTCERKLDHALKTSIRMAESERKLSAAYLWRIRPADPQLRERVGDLLRREFGVLLRLTEQQWDRISREICALGDAPKAQEAK
jgi:hypothetical protein